MSGVSHHRHEGSCEDSRGAIRKNNDTWREHDCRVCECKVRLICSAVHPVSYFPYYLVVSSIPKLSLFISSD